MASLCKTVRTEISVFHSRDLIVFTHITSDLFSSLPSAVGSPYLKGTVQQKLRLVENGIN
jgi:hypothetical protein